MMRHISLSIVAAAAALAAACEADKEIKPRTSRLTRQPSGPVMPASAIAPPESAEDVHTQMALVADSIAALPVCGQTEGTAGRVAYVAGSGGGQSSLVACLLQATAWSWVPMQVGASGGAGQKGDKGESGAKGDKGDKGDAGVAGAVGAAGAAGATGATGPQGPAGTPAPAAFAAHDDAPDGSVYVSEDGKLGIGTSTPGSELTVVGGTVPGTSTFGVDDVIFSSPVLVLQPPAGTHLVQPNSGVHSMLHLKAAGWFRGQSTGIAATFGDFSKLSRIVHYSDVGNSHGTRLQMQTNIHNAADTWTAGVKIYENGAVTVGVDGDPVGAPGAAGDLIVGGYTQLATTSGQPDNGDCNASARGRMKVDSASGLLWICVDSGWTSK